MENKYLEKGQSLILPFGIFTAPISGNYSIHEDSCLYNPSYINIFNIVKSSITIDSSKLEGYYTSIPKQLDQVLEYVKDRYKLNNDTANKLYIAGGAIRSLILNEEVKDYDIFIENDEVKTLLLEESKTKCNGSYISDNAITLYSPYGQIQIITTKTGFPWEVIDEFDFVMNQNYYCPNLTVAGVCDGLYIADIDTVMSKKLKINKHCRNKLGTLARLAKFLERGYLPPNKLDLVELGIAISKLNPITTLTELASESKLYLNAEEVSGLCDGTTLAFCSDEEIDSLNNRGSGL